jgi:hypothetical protein
LQAADLAPKLAHMTDFTPEDMEAVADCLRGLDGNVPIQVEPAAAALLLPHSVRNVRDILILPAWPAERLRLVVERWQQAVEESIERIR